MFKNIFAFVMTSALWLTAHAGLQPKPRGYELYGNPHIRTALPPNNLHLRDRVESTANVTEEQFNQIVDAAIAIYQPFAKARGVTLVGEKDWKDSTVNAYAYQSGKTWFVNMFGGLARRPEVTPDGFALVVCHELGHHFSGYPFVSSWAGNEGNSDYFATHACAKLIWGKDFRGNESWRRIRNIPQVVSDSCAKAWPNNANAQGWCVRAAAAGQSLANLLAALGNDKAPSFDTPDTSVVRSTNNAHPKAQCRLDTYFQGALCPKAWNPNVIPGAGKSAKDGELESMKMSCYAQEGFTIGTRPTCWFKSVL